jgi:hypothetical protein
MLARATLLSVAMFAGVLMGGTSALAQPGPLLPAQSELASSPGQLQFGEVGIHFGATPQESVTISNESPSPVTVMAATLLGTDSSSFQIVNDGCANQTIEPAGSCAVEIRFQPSERGEKSATLSVDSLGGEGALEIPLSGTGSTGALSANPISLSFSAIPYTRGEHEESQNETEQVNINSLDAGVQIESVSITGPDASSFSVQYGDCEGDQMGENNWCDEGIRFQPGSPGAKHAQLVIKSDSSNGPLVVPLEGEGLLGPQVSLDSDESQLGDVPIGSTASHTFPVTNTGDYPLFIQQSFLVSGTPKMFPVLSNTCNGQIIMPGGSCEFTVGFDPTTAGEKDASLIFITNATPQINVLGVDGVGIAPAPDVVTGAPQALVPASEAPIPQAPLSPPVSKRANVAPAHLLTFGQASRLYSSPGNEAVNTGVDAQCPAGAGSCQTESLITTRIRGRRSKTAVQNVGHTEMLLGSRIAHLRGGEHAAVRIPLTNGGVALLERRGHVRATIEMVIRSGGRIIAERARTVTLVS